MFKSSVLTRIAGTSLRLVKNNQRIQNTIVKQARYQLYSTSKNNQETNKKEDAKAQSILTDDLLAKAGFEDKQPEEQKSTSSKETIEEEEAEAEGSNQSNSNRRRKRRAQTTKDIQREKYANWFYISTLVGGVAGAGWISRNWDSEEEQDKLDGKSIPNGFNPSNMYQRSNKRLGSLFTFFSEPAFENLLPPPPPEAYRRPMTLVLTLDDLLIHSHWDVKNGWRTAKRPGLDYFLGYLSQYYEIVVFGSNLQMYSEKTVAKLDPLHAYISYALFREGCRYKDGKLIKDLDLLNRDLGKVIMVDVEEEPCSLQPNNSIVLKPWDGKPDDTLIRLIPFLEFIATQPVKDVRPILNTFNDKSNIIEEFSEREAKLRAKWYEENKHLIENSGKINAIYSRLMGVEPSNKKSSSGPKMPLDIIREHGQLQYEHFQKYLKENGPKFLEEEQKLKDEFGKLTLNKIITEGPPSAEDIAKVQAERLQKEKEQQGQQ